MSPARRLAAAGLLALALVGLGRRLDAGEPARPSAVRCDPALTIDGELHCGLAIAAALRERCGGSTADADMGRLRSGDAVVAANGCTRGDRIPGPELLALGVAIDLNTASAAELEALPGIGPTLARRIVEARPLARINDLLRVHGIGDRRLAGLRPHVTVEITAGFFDAS